MPKRPKLGGGAKQYTQAETKAPENTKGTIDATIQSSVFLTPAQFEWLEDKRREAHQGSGKRIRKAVIIRALIDVARELTIDLRGAEDELQVKARIREALLAQRLDFEA